jgi:hypothetical protein
LKLQLGNEKSKALGRGTAANIHGGKAEEHA